ncbi:MAG: type II toxin-antitoxin system ParD family antitoxin [Nostoc sp.]|uniref:ribbon-helix-helix domain-containing protein n=1 Tax=Nostoc sp. TaxID=1180 RepID=UPI002FFC582C
MTQFNISLPPAVEEYLHQQISQGDYKNLEDYIYHLILEDQKRNTQEKLETMLIDGLDSGAPIPITEEWWQQKRAELVKKLP